MIDFIYKWKLKISDFILKYMDKIGHFCMSFFMTFFFYLFLGYAFFDVFTWNILILSSCITFLITLSIEIADKVTGKGNSSLGDIFANTLGILLIIIIIGFY